MPFNLSYTMVQKSKKWPKTQIKGGGLKLLQSIFYVPVRVTLRLDEVQYFIAKWQWET